MAKKAIILDTDIGTDVDDAFALGLILKSPELDLRAVTIATNRASERAQIALRMLEAAGRLDVPVALGREKPILAGFREFPWGGWEGKGVLELYTNSLPTTGEPAPLLISRLARENPGEITLIPIGPLTNLGIAFALDAELARNLKEVLIMGGVGRFAPQSWTYPIMEHNTSMDPEATRIVLESGAKIRMVGLDVTMRVQIPRAAIPQLCSEAGKLGELLANQLEVYLDTHKRDATYMHDPLTVAFAIDDTLCKTVPMRVQMETQGQYTRGMTVFHHVPKEQSNAEVVVDVDAPRFEEFLLDRLLGR